MKKIEITWLNFPFVLSIQGTPQSLSLFPTSFFLPPLLAICQRQSRRRYRFFFLGVLKNAANLNWNFAINFWCRRAKLSQLSEPELELSFGCQRTNKWLKRNGIWARNLCPALFVAPRCVCATALISDLPLKYRDRQREGGGKGAPSRRVPWRGLFSIFWKIPSAIRDQANWQNLAHRACHIRAHQATGSLEIYCQHNSGANSIWGPLRTQRPNKGGKTIFDSSK